MTELFTAVHESAFDPNRTCASLLDHLVGTPSSQQAARLPSANKLIREANLRRRACQHPVSLRRGATGGHSCWGIIVGILLQGLSAFQGQSGRHELTASCPLVTKSVGLPPPFQSEQFCSVTVIDGAYISDLASVRAARKTATYRILRFPQLAA